MFFLFFFRPPSPSSSKFIYMCFVQALYIAQKCERVNLLMNLSLLLIYLKNGKRMEELIEEYEKKYIYIC